jgi:hypothetical protein
LLTPIYELQHDYTSLCECYSRLHTTYEHVRANDASGRNTLPLATYFRVAFSGQCHFDEDHGREYIYAWAACTSLAEACDRLRAHTALYLRHERIQLLADANTGESVDHAGAVLDESVAYIQMTHVHPVAPCDAIDDTAAPSLTRLLAGAQMHSGYETSTNVSQFMYETKTDELQPSTGAGEQLMGEQARVVAMGKRCVLLTSKSTNVSNTYAYVQLRALYHTC